jgi:hypothetical protein
VSQTAEEKHDVRPRATSNELRRWAREIEQEPAYATMREDIALLDRAASKLTAACAEIERLRNGD